MKKTYNGSCHCKAVTFEVSVDLSAGTGRCNCSICIKRRAWNALVKPEDFTLLSGRDSLSDYSFGSMQGHNRFCSKCGCAPFSDGDIPEVGGPFVAIAVNTLDLTPEEFGAIPISYANGRENTWWEPPKVTNYL